jgi:hypothetical protein
MARILKGDLNMSREDRRTLEEIAFDMVISGMDHNGEAEYVWDEIKKTSDEDLLAYITEE